MNGWVTKSTYGRVLPGFGLCMGFTLVYLSLIVLIPLSGLFITAAKMSQAAFWDMLTAPPVVAAFKVSFLTALLAALINAPFGAVVAWVLVRYRFRGQKLLDALVDLPFALPTAVAGITLTALYASNGWFGSFFAFFGLQIAYTPVGIVVALVFIGLPFVVRTVAPVLQELEPEFEEAAASLGASWTQIVLKVILPQLMPALLTGFALAFARGLGEYGSVIFIAGNIPMVSQIIPLVIVIELEQYHYQAATAIALVMLMASFVLLLAINLLQKWSLRRAS